MHIRRVGLLFAALVFVSTLARAQAPAWLLASPEPRVRPGGAFEVVVISVAPVEWPARLPAQVELPGNGTRIAIELVAAGSATGDRQRRYVGTWPREAVGVAVLALREVATARILLDATAVDAPSAQAAYAGVGQESPRAPAASVEPAEPAALGFHEPMYFVVGGRDPLSARYQLSFRYRIFDDRGVVADTFPLVRGLYFGFTQTSLWDLDSDSRPFRDTSFRPSLFYQWKLSSPRDGGSLAVAGGYEHESNGRDGEDSRSIDTLFVKAEARHYLPDGRTYVGVAPKLWSYVDKRDNPDIARYRGYGELGLRVGRDEGLMLAALLRRGTDGAGSTQLDLSYPLRRSIFSGVGAFAHLQYFKGYGETLLDYDESRDAQIRIGISLVR